MRAKKYLRQVRRIDDLVKAKFEQIEILRSISTKITTDLSADRVQGSHNPDKMSGLVAKIVDLENEITNDINELLSLQREVTNKINSMSNPEYRLLLSLRYLDFKTWEQIAVDMGFTYQWIHILHNRALIEFEKLITVDCN